MKHTTTLAFAILLSANVFGQNINDTESDFNEASNTDLEVVITDEDVLVELVAVFNDAIDAPTKYNAYVKPYISMSGFPQKGDASKEEYDKLLMNWINSNPETIEHFHIDRQKAHDELYGPRKKD